MPPLTPDNEKSRRHFLKLMGASLSLAGMTGCIRMPEEKLVPYARRPNRRSPGVPVRYATAMEIGGIAQGLLVTSVDGRPIKIEGNPSHPLNRGACDAIAQASILELYDPDRSRGVIRRDKDGTRRATSWEEFERWAKGVFKGDGHDICVLSEYSQSPSLEDMRKRFKKAFPKAQWYEYEPIDDQSRLGYPLNFCTAPDLSKAKVIVSLDADLFGASDLLSLQHTRDFAAGREPANSTGGMNRLYVIESALSVTGACADHRRAVKASDILGAATQLALAIGLKVEGAAPRLSAVDPAFLNAVVTDLKANKGRAIVVAGPQHSYAIHFLVRRINEKLGNLNETIVAWAPIGSEDVEYFNHVGQSLGTLATRMRAGEIGTLLILGCNPVYDAPSNVNFVKALNKVRDTVHLGLYDDETSRLCDWHLSQAHGLESWGDARTFDGTASIMQPLIEPLFGGRSDIELLATILGDEVSDGHSIVQRTFRSLLGESFSEWKWKNALAKGVVEGTAFPRDKSIGVNDNSRGPTARGGAPKNAAPNESSRGPLAPGYFRNDAAYELVFFTDSKVYDGRYANNGWLQEFPDPMTRVTWGNAALMNEETAKKIGVKNDDVVALQAKETQEVEFPVLIQHGMADGVIAVALGYGRTAAGEIGNGVGGNAYLLRDTESIERGWAIVKARPTGKIHKLATVQDHHIIDAVGREAVQERIPELIHEGTLAEYRKDPSLGHKHGPSEPLYPVPPLDGREPAAFNTAASNANVPSHNFHRWGMAVDLNACVGCGACVVACQAENNIPIVGREQVLLGREMHWIRVDRYFREAKNETDKNVCPPGKETDRNVCPPGKETDRNVCPPGKETDKNGCPPGSVHQPVLCMQCENAPCEEVCPFAATTHSLEGLNMMTYNRCGGTRYCSNNCPYKVRRFNYFDFNAGTLKDLYTPNLVREPISELLRMQKNPDVTVRMRGVMEKCTYCIQRIEQARMAAKREADRPIRDGEIQTACQQTCPASAIVFGDLNDPESRVSKLHAEARSYGLLDSELNTRPRTRYLARVRNPAPGLER